ncbi:MAG: ankyrin repeat domain-containing protein [Candidatus Kapaibacterium sp.]
MKKISIVAIAFSFLSCCTLRAQVTTPSGLFDAVVKRNVKVARRYLLSDSSLAFSYPMGAGASLIHFAAMFPLLPLRRGESDGPGIVSLLLDWGVSADDTNGNGGGTPLNAAAAMGHVAIAKLLLRKHANINSLNSKRMTPLMEAAEDGYPKVVKLLLDNGADISTKDYEGKTALDWSEEPPEDDNFKHTPEVNARYKLVKRLLSDFHKKIGNSKINEQTFQDQNHNTIFTVSNNGTIRDSTHKVVGSVNENRDYDYVIRNAQNNIIGRITSINEILDGDPGGVSGYCDFVDQVQIGYSSKLGVIGIREHCMQDVGLCHTWWVYNYDSGFDDAKFGDDISIYDANSNLRGYVKGISNKYWIVAILEFFFGK